MKKPEILSPAGDMEKLRYAVAYGADAVYLAGSQFGMRTGAGNFTYEEMAEAVKHCHENGVKVMVTVNTMPRNNEFAVIDEHIKKIAECGADGVIVADIGVLEVVKRVAPQLRITISTQANVTNYGAATAYYNMGANRVVLARELTLDEVIHIRENTPPELEIETFIHGSMCMSISGRCLLSNYMTGRDSNRGNCAQPCRWKYHLVEEKRPGQYMPIIEDDKGSYIFNSKDMCMIEHIPALVKAGINSFKIEGRAKSAYYTAAITKAYRKAIDLYFEDPENYELPDSIRDEIFKVSHRQYFNGFYFGDTNSQDYNENIYIRDWDIVAVVDGKDENGLTLLTQKNKFFANDTLEVLRPDGECVQFVPEILRNERDEDIESAPHAEMKLKMKLPCDAPALSIIRKEKTN